MRQLEKNGMNNEEVIIQGVLHENCNCAHCLHRLPKCLPETAKAQEAYSATKKKDGGASKLPFNVGAISQCHIPSYKSQECNKHEMFS